MRSDRDLRYKHTPLPGTSAKVQRPTGVTPLSTRVHYTVLGRPFRRLPEPSAPAASRVFSSALPGNRRQLLLLYARLRGWLRCMESLWVLPCRRTNHLSVHKCMSVTEGMSKPATRRFREWLLDIIVTPTG